ncbi:hypothetical protein [Flagellimonas nanhaiensis]|uniref:Uncharacterized protein n=1 Tax=Flagellimonas nanhaiensis TaxID=2292706 RepID=A0A371JL87_9FLAO|nr:hypothetical protein [Allomuricauda nanhaiensis]RDY57717.1 hypothetical protein DX873_17615 [Allomuricauda nanhaiensis]
MARDKKNQQNIDNSNLSDYPNGRIRDNSGAGNGTPVNEQVYGDIHEAFAKLMRLAGVVYNDLPDNESNGHQLVEALAALPSKNDFVLDIGSANGKLTITTKLGTLKDNETFLCKATIDSGSETQIRGSDNTDKTITKVGNFKNGEYVNLINTASSIVLVRQGNAVSLDAMVGELLYLKAASNAQELAGLLDTVATTPLGNALAFTEWVIGTQSAASLANALRNGLYPKEHFEIVQNIGSSPTRNIGFISGIDVGGGGSIGTTFPVGGNITNCSLVYKNGGAGGWRLTMDNAMDNTNYFVRMHPQTQGSVDNDTEVQSWNFKPISTTQFEVYAEENLSATQSIKLHVEVVQL